jgi:hypothetical protein
MARLNTKYLLRGASRTEWEHSIPAVDALCYSITCGVFGQGPDRAKPGFPRRPRERGVVVPNLRSQGMPVPGCFLGITFGIPRPRHGGCQGGQVAGGSQETKRKFPWEADFCVYRGLTTGSILGPADPRRWACRLSASAQLAQQWHPT